MPVRSKLYCFVSLFLVLLCSTVAFAQFTSNVQGIVQDPSGRAIADAAVRIVNQNTQVAQTTTSDSSGNFRFVSLAPGPYRITIEAKGFAKAESDITLLTEQNLNVPITLKVGTVTENVTVTTQAPLVDTADSRNEMTLENSGVAELPVQGRNLVTLTTLAPGVSGLGTLGGQTPGQAGTPGSATDNYSTETAVDVSANGQGQMSNMYVIDGLDVTSGIRQGVLNLTPNPESIQEASVQVNTYSPEYSRATGVEEVMTTKSGSEHFHGSAADWFYFQKMFATEEAQVGPTSYLPFHGNNMSFSVGGPIVPHHQFYGFFAVEPLRAASAASGSITFADPQFIAYAQAGSALPVPLASTVGTQILNTYTPVNVLNVTPTTAQTYFGNNAAGTPICQADPAEIDNIPCALQMQDTGTFNAVGIRNGTQYFIRVDKDFAKNRVYGSFYRTLLNYGQPSAIPAFSALNNNWQRAIQINYTHTFSPTLLNEAIFAANRVEGVLGSGAKDYTVPSIAVSGISTESGQAFGVGFAQGDFIQHNYHWRDVLTHVRGAHTLKFGYEGWYGDDVEPFQGPWSQPTFSFDNLLDLAEDAPHTEGHVMYNPITGSPQLWSWDAASRTWGIFAEDTWRARKHLTVTLGLRWDDSGNPWSKSPSTVFGNFYLGTGSTFQQQVASGYAKPTQKAFQNAVTNLWSPRIGIAWDVTGNGNTVLRGGFGIFNNWLTQANVQEEFRGNPPGLISPNFGPSVLLAPGVDYFHLGTGGKPPFGFDTAGDYPPLMVNGEPCSYYGSTGCLNSQGGVLGANAAIGAINPKLKSPKANIWSLTFEQKIGSRYSASAGYAGSHGYNMVGAGDYAGIVSYGQTINAYALDLYNHNSMTPTRLNPSFGSIVYTANDRYSNYESVFFEFKGRFARGGFFEASYTRSKSQDDAGNYPAEATPSTFYGPSPWDVPNRLSLTVNYELRGLNSGHGALGHVTGGWGVSGTTVFQSGYPAFVTTSAPFVALCADGTNSSDNPTGCPTAANVMTQAFGPGSGDYNVDGESANTVASVVTGGLDYPNATSYQQGTSKSAFLNGVFTSGQFATPTFGTEGNEKAMQFRSPNFEETDLNIYKNTAISERFNFQVRFEFFNIFNRVNLTNFDSNLADLNSTFGKARSQQLPRNWQIGGRLTF